MQLLGLTSGSIHLGMSSSARISSSQRRVLMLNSMVREALEKSVTWALPPVSFQMSQVSTVPNSSSPRSARARTPGTFSRIQRSLVPEK